MDVGMERGGGGQGIHAVELVGGHLPEELGPWRTQLQDAAHQALALIQRGRGRGEVELTDPHAARERREESVSNMRAARTLTDTLTQLLHGHGHT